MPQNPARTRQRTVLRVRKMLGKEAIDPVDPVDAKARYAKHQGDPDEWVTTRTDPIVEFGGWWPHNHGNDDQTKFFMRNMVKPKPPQWRLLYISPLTSRIQGRRMQGGMARFYDERGEFHDPDGLAPLEHVTTARRSEANRDKVLALMREPLTLAEILERVGVNRHTYYTWRVRFPAWATEVDIARHQTGADRDEHDEDFFSRRRYYFGHESYAHHRRIVQAIEDTPDGGVTLILLPPEAGKTTLLEEWCADQIGQNPNIRILYVSETAEGHARKVLDELKEQLTDPNLEIPDCQYPSHIAEFQIKYGPFRDSMLDRNKPWNNKYIKVHGATGQRDYTFQAIGWKSKVYGARADWIIFDDVQSSESINSTERIMAVLRRTYFSRTRKGKIVFIGTRVDLGDVYEALELAGIPHQIVKIPALDDEGNSYWPERWTAQDLADKKKLSGDGWWPVYMMAPQLAKAATFTPEIVEGCFDVTLPMGYHQAFPDYRKVAGLDPALSGPAALGAAAFNSSRFVLLSMEVREQLARNENILMWLAELARTVPYSELVLELSAVSKGLRNDQRLKRMSEEIYGFRIVDHDTTKSTKEDVDFGIGEMAGSFIRGEIVLPYGDDLAQAMTNKLVAEMYRWRPGMQGKDLVQDQVIALWVMWRRWRRVMAGLESAHDGLDSWRVRGTPWQPGDMSGGLWLPSRPRPAWRDQGVGRAPAPVGPGREW